MVTSASRSGGCGCGAAHAPDGCGCGERGPRETPGACGCAGPERAGIACLERPVYSAGQLLTADALRLGQRYLEDRLALRRYVDGVGVVCGLRVRCDAERPGWIVVEPGYAVDCLGNDLVLCEPVRMDFCAALARCGHPRDPSDDIGEAPRAAPPVTLPAAYPAQAPLADATLTAGLLMGTVTDAAGQPIAQALVEVSGTSWRGPARQDGKFWFPAVAPGEYTVLVSRPGYRSATCRVTVAAGRATEVDFRLPPEQLLEAAKAEGGVSVYSLRAEPAWEGREPVPVITQRGSCDPRPECRASKEAASLWLCLEPLEERPPGRLADERTQRFRRLGQALFDRIARVLEAPIPRERLNVEEGERWRARALVDVFLRSIQEDPPASACALSDLLGELHRVLGGQSPRCELPLEAVEHAGWLLAGVMGHLLDGWRERFLAAECDDCCARTGVRLAQVLVDERLARCSGGGCAIVGIDAHPPAREALHPRSDWWRRDRVSLYDAYFRGSDEAGVLLSARGLRVAELDATRNDECTPELPGGIAEWLRAERPGELARLGLYQCSDLYAPYGSEVTLWVVEGRVVAITAAGWGSSGDGRFTYSFPRYLEHPLRGDQARAPAAGAAEGTLTFAAAAAGGTRMRTAAPPPAAAMDPAPFSAAIGEVTEKNELQLYRAGIRTFSALAEADYATVRAAIGLRLSRVAFEALRDRARDIAEGGLTYAAGDLERWTADATRRLAEAEGGAP